MLTRARARRVAAGAALAVSALALLPVLADAILVAPHAVFMDHRTRTGQVFLVNQGTEPEEVSVELRYGYPDADTAGNVFINFPDSTAPNRQSAAAWIRAFPRRAVVLPGAQQVVRLLATPPADLPDGEYWSRVIVTSHGAPVPVAGADTAVRAQITLEVKTIISLMYRKGAVRTGLVLNDFRASFEHDSLILRMDLGREGNAAWLGTVHAAMRDPMGRQTPREWESQLAVYTSQRRRIGFPVGRLPAGVYTVSLVLSTDRSDIARSDVLQTPPIQRTVTLEVATQ